MDLKRQQRTTLGAKLSFVWLNSASYPQRDRKWELLCGTATTKA